MTNDTITTNPQSVSTQNEGEIENEFAKMHYGFKAAYENFVERHNNPGKFAEDLNAKGFSRYWPLSGQEKDAAYSGLCSKLEDLMGARFPKNDRKILASDILDEMIKIYNNEIGVIDIFDM